MARYLLLENGVDRLLLEDGSGLLLLEEQSGGAEQPTPNGGDITIEDDVHGDTAYDSTISGYQSGYSPEDLYQRAVALGWKAADAVTGAVLKTPGAVPHYLFKVNVQNGDGVGSAVTTFRATRCTFEFEDGKAYKVSATGRANRHVHFGSLQENAPSEPTGYDGVDATFGADTNLEGNHRVYGSRVVQAKGRLSIRREGSAQISDVVGSVLETLEPSGLGINFGALTQDNDRVFDMKVNILGHPSGGIQIFNVKNARKIKAGGIALIPFGSPTVYLRLRDAAIAGVPGTADIRSPSQGSDLIDITWSRQAPQTIGTTPNIWATWLPTMVDAAGVPESGAFVELKDVEGIVILSASSDAQGQITYSTASPTGLGDLIADAVCVKKIASSPYYRGPFTVYVNGVARRTFDWPKVQYVVNAVTYDQLLPVRDVIGPEGILQANFTVSPGGGTGPLTVQFDDLSVPRIGHSITAWLWDFGDGQTSIEQSPSHVYGSDGLYTVSLTVTDDGGSTSLTVVGAVYVIAPNPTVDVGYYREEDIALLLADSGQDVSVAGVTTKGFVERKTIEVVEGGETFAMGIEIRVTVKSDSLPGLAVGVDLSVDGIVHKVREFKRIGDGALTEILVALEN